MFLEDLPLLSLLWRIVVIFVWIGWIMLVFRIFGDILRSQSGGVSKALWTIFVILVPFLGVFLYLIIHGGQMNAREAEAVQRSETAFQDYVRQAAGSSADELTKLASLRDSGVITEDEFAQQKAKILG